MRSLKGKISMLNPVWNFGTLWSIYSAVQNNVITNLSASEARELWEFSKGLELDEVENFVLSDQSGLIRPQTVNGQNGVSYALVSSADNPYDYANIEKSIQEFIQSQ